MLDQLLGDNKNALIETLTAKLGVSDGQAGGFLDKLLSSISSLVQDDKLDVQKLLSGDLSAVTGLLDMDGLGSLLGGGADKAEQGINAVAGPLGEQLGGADDLLGKLGLDGGSLGSLKDIAGGFFK